MLTENAVVARVVKYLGDKGYTDIKGLTSIQKGIDITATAPGGGKHYIEAKGETSNVPTSARYNEAFDGKQIWSHVSVALLKTLTTINSFGSESTYGMAFPANHKELCKLIKASTDKLGIVIYLVSEENVWEL